MEIERRSTTPSTRNLERRDRRSRTPQAELSYSKINGRLLASGEDGVAREIPGVDTCDPERSGFDPSCADTSSCPVGRDSGVAPDGTDRRCYRLTVDRVERGVVEVTPEERERLEARLRAARIGSYVLEPAGKGNIRAREEA